MAEFSWHTSSPEQLVRANDLATKWRAEAHDPLVAIGASLTILLNVFAHEVPAEYHEEGIEVIARTLREYLL